MKGSTFREIIREDVESRGCFFDDTEFAQHLNINGHDILGVMTQNKRYHEFDPHTGTISRSGMLLFLKESDIKNVNTGQVLRVNSKAYVITNAMLAANGVWRIELKVTGG